MMLIKIRERGATPRRLVSATNAASKESYRQIGIYFHEKMRDKRFTPEHARKAGYQSRTKKYQKRKLKKFGRNNPLEFSGKTRQLTRFANITSTRNRVRVAYSGARALNYRTSSRAPYMFLEFSTLINSEIKELAREFDRTLDIERAARGLP